jgi:hypothetical protein
MSQFQNRILTVPSTAVNTNGIAVDCSNVIQASVHVVATGTPTGAVKIQVSNDSPIGLAGQNGSPWVPTNWVDLASVTIPVTAAGSFLIPKFDVCYQFIRAVYTGTGTGTAVANLKVHSR